MSVSTGLYNTILGQVLFHAAFQTGFCTFFMRNFIKELPFELIESGRIEGVGEIKIFLFIVVPLVRPALAAPVESPPSRRSWVVYIQCH